MKLVPLIITCFLVLNLSAQDEVKNRGNNIEALVIPAYFMNHFMVGYSYRQAKKREYTLALNYTFAGNLYSAFGYNTNASLSANFYFKNDTYYVPLWARVGNSRNDTGFESGYIPHRLNLSIGTGLGSLGQISRKFFIRGELGFGICYTQSSYMGPIYPVSFDFSEYSTDYNPRDQTPFRPAVRVKLTLMRNLSRNK